MRPILKLNVGYFIFGTVLLSYNTYAQKTTIGIKAGLANSNSTIKYYNTSAQSNKANSEVGLSILTGVYCNISMGKNFALRPGVELVGKGNISGYFPGRITYVDLPLNILYKVKHAKGNTLVGGGPVIGIPIGQYHGFSSVNYTTDVGINALAGFEFLIGFGINLNYTYGLLNVISGNSTISKVNNRYVGFTLSYTF